MLLHNVLALPDFEHALQLDGRFVLAYCSILKADRKRVQTISLYHPFA
ncbi:MAG TPA: hypothetical protein VHV10_09515 [Ktedonobacteraceae bacterium]|nr:hypothetical protein [Ktedonobacteraceae bacterium]